jgi:hypothetical protein
LALIASLRHPSITRIAVDDQARGLAIFGLSQLLGTSGFLVTYCGSRRAPSQGRHDRLLLLAEVFSADRPVAGAARASVRGAEDKWDKRRQQRCASIQAKQRVSAPRRSQLAGSTTLLAPARNLPLPEKTSEGALLAAKSPGIWGMSAKRESFLQL